MAKTKINQTKNGCCIHAHVASDRVAVTLSRTYQLAPYQPYQVQAYAASDSRVNESMEHAFKRVTKVVQDQFEQMCSLVENEAKGGK